MPLFISKSSLRIQIGALLSAAIIAIGILQFLMFYVAVTSSEFRISTFIEALGPTGGVIFIGMIVIVIVVDLYINKLLSQVEAEIDVQRKLNDAVLFVDDRLGN